MDRFILIDGNAILHRAFHALPSLTNKDGVISNAVYGFFSMFLKIVQDIKPTHIIVCFDRPKPTFRKALYAGYQAQRPKMADDLVPQIAIVHDMLKKLHITIFEVDGYEADDLIGTLSKQAVSRDPDSRGAEVANKNFLVYSAKKVHRSNSTSTLASVPSENFISSPRQNNDVEVIIVSGDRDLLQLVNSHVKMLAPVTGITNMILYDEKAVMDKFGIKPSQMIDYKALVGDASDNYPGVTGIGPKTAKDLLTQYQTLENLYAHIQELPEKISQKLAIDAEQAALAKKLATIVTDAPITLKEEVCRREHFDTHTAKKVFEEMGFKSLLSRFSPDEKKEKVVKEEKNQQLGLL